MTAPAPLAGGSSAAAVIVFVPGARAHYELEWRGIAGHERAGVWYPTAHAAREMAVVCGAKEIIE